MDLAKNANVSSLSLAGRESLEAELTALDEMALPDLRATWVGHFQKPPPNRLSRDLLVRGIAHRLQERQFGGLSKSVLRRIEYLRANDGSTGGPPPKRTRSIKPGTKLIREWHGVKHTVVVTDDGFDWQGTRYRSLTHIARAITGAHWSGPRFFGLPDIGGARSRATA
jgi:Protein of unknown function (DUF2924)